MLKDILENVEEFVEEHCAVVYGVGAMLILGIPVLFGFKYNVQEQKLRQELLQKQIAAVDNPIQIHITKD